MQHVKRHIDMLQPCNVERSIAAFPSPLMSWFTRLRDAATSVSNAALAAAADVSATFSLDNMQTEFGDPTGRKALFEGLDVTYLTPRIIGA